MERQREALHDQVRRGVEALRRGRPSEAVDALGPVFADPELCAAAELRDVRARIGSLLAQALIECGRASEAEAPLAEAQRLAAELGDAEGLAALRELSARITIAAAQRHQKAVESTRMRKLADTPIERLLEGVTAPLARADVFLRKANASIELERTDEAAEFALRALELAAPLSAVREEVLAYMTLARALPHEALVHLRAALARAEQENEFTLVGGIVRAAELARVPLPTVPYAGTPPVRR